MSADLEANKIKDPSRNQKAGVGSNESISFSLL